MEDNNHHRMSLPSAGIGGCLTFVDIIVTVEGLQAVDGGNGGSVTTAGEQLVMPSPTRLSLQMQAKLAHSVSTTILYRNSNVGVSQATLRLCSVGDSRI